MDGPRRLDLLFDLDGTLADPAEGITACILHALRALGRPERPPEDLHRWIGPPLRDAMAALLATEDPELVERAIASYRERYASRGIHENRLYSEVVGSLEELVSRGHRLWVATSKPTVFARQVLAHFELDRHFAGIHGAELDGRNSDKGDLLAELLRSERLDPSRTWMIGDRSYDVRAARRHGLRAIAVTWGYGSREELEACVPDAMVGSMAELLDLARG